MIKPGTPQARAAMTEPGITDGVENAYRAAIRSVSSTELLGARGELKIQHNGEQYSLRRTRQGKLILTK